MSVLNSVEFEKWGRATDAAHLMAKLIRNCVLNPDATNQRILRSPFSEFLHSTTTALAHIHMRNSGMCFVGIPERMVTLGNSMASRITSRSLPHALGALASALQGVGFQDAAALTTGSKEVIDAATLVRVIEAFVIGSYNKEQPEHIAAIAEAWTHFTTSCSPFALECVRRGDGSFMSDLAATPSNLWATKLTKPASASDIQDVLDIQQEYAEAHDAPNYGTESRRFIKTLLNTYDGFMQPEIMIFRGHDHNAVVSRRMEFERLKRKDWLMKTAAILHAHNDTVDEAQRVPEVLIKRMQRGTINAPQTRCAPSQEPLSVEHTTPLSGSDNFSANFSIIPKLINNDLEQLFTHQIRGMLLNRDVLSPYRRDGDFDMAVTGDSIPVIVLRPHQDPVTGMAAPILTTPPHIRDNPLRPIWDCSRQHSAYQVPENM
jgi:hypothetical protein